MKKYEDYQIEDYIQDRSFRRWILTDSEPDKVFWTAWLKVNVEKQGQVDEAATMVRAFQIHESQDCKTELEKDIASIMLEVKNGKPFWQKNSAWIQIAAIFIVLSSIVFWFTKIQLTNDQVINEKSVSNSGEDKPTKTNRIIKLSDGSMVILDANSSLDIDVDFGKENRKVILKGGAIFEVAKNVNQPFYVYTGGLITKVLGTSFRVDAFEKEANISVSVTTGKVSVFKNEASRSKVLSEEMILIPNQQAVFLKEANKLVKSVVAIPIMKNESVQSVGFVYSETAINSVFKDLEQAYEITLLYDEDIFQDCNLTANLKKENLFEKLGLICQTIRAQYQIIDGQIVITGKGCN